RESSTQIKDKHNKLLESIKICDPSVGSGHFLVSALNEMIYIYYKLGLLGFGCSDLKIIDDEILLTTKNKEKFAYKRFDNANHQIQIALFHLKKSIIENNLFGVDINPNSCNIARLRLWIELLKNAYYLNFANDKDSKIHKLQTLPNIDINIKCGNSLVSHFPTFEYDKNQKAEKHTFAWLKGQDAKFSQNFKEKLLRYNHLVQTYKERLGDKQEIEKEIKELKAFFKDTLLKNSFTMKSLEDALRAFVQTYGDECFDIETPFGMEMIKIIRDKNRHERGYKFQSTLDQLEPSPIDKKGQDLLNEIYKAYLEIENLKNQETFEWRFEFPEVLDLETFEEKQARIEANNLAKQNHQNSQKLKDTFGDFLGFDLVIGNPPYIRQEEIKHLKPQLQKAFSIFNGTSDIYTYFFELGTKILKNNGILSFITSNKWCRTAYGEPLREFLLENTTINTYVDLNGVKVFDSATVDTGILEFIKAKAPKSHAINYANPKDYNPKEDKPLEPKYSQIPQDSLKTESFIFSDSKLTALKAKIEAKGTPLKDWDINIYRGVLTGYNEAFIIDSEKREEILAKCKNEEEIIRTSEIIKPILRGRDIKRYRYEWAGLWIINVHNGYKDEQNNKIPPIDINEYPTLKAYFDDVAQNGKQGKGKGFYNRDDKGITPYNLRNCAYLPEFAKPKIIYSEIVREPQFYLDNGEFKFGYFYAEATSFILSANCHSESALAGEESPKDSIRDVSHFTNAQHDKAYKSPQANNKVCHSERSKESLQDLESRLQDLERLLDSKIFALYGLSDEEIAIISGGGANIEP
ncbi:MAG: Eco57I restriction-modification methylase domain-containing protein, partial [Lachnospiraceae bacterium]|nr:Eco57I restriction-modification methylase domain-containing protein [Lachnospiraceae bacterium]